ncbi:folylpolyglutamate synthase 1 isoform X2 [Leptinotarsa decemlineata]|uniref:folylpolyglutamate synthase 1 isoform X2 n=1 Tax=Leptinotarsa decemlineata TaxID=7539 RepID=UPI003D3083E4
MRLPRFAVIRRALSYTIKSIESMQVEHTENYQSAIKALNGLQTNAQYIKNAANKPNIASKVQEVAKFLKRSGVSLEQLDKLSVIHVTGTNGKGTTCAYCESILRNHGYKTGFFSSPHLLDVRERIRIDGKPISKSMFAKYFWKIYPLLDKQKVDSSDMPLYFRFLAVLAFHVFLEHEVDVAIIEVGIGGEYDCTNIIRNTAVVGITPLDMDHTSLLGNSLESIAWNKSGIMKEGCLAFSTKQPPNVLQVFQDRSLERKCSFKIVEENSYLENNSYMPPHVRRTNASLALALTEAFMSREKSKKKKFSLELAKQSIEETRWPGRYEIKHFKGFRFYLDGAHTFDSICVCRDWFDSHTSIRNVKKCLIFNITGERDPEMFFKELGKCEFDAVIFIPNVGGENDRSADFKLPEDKQLQRCEAYRLKWLTLEELFEKRSETVCVKPSFSKAVEFLEISYNDCDILVTGSIHLIGAALSVLDPTLNGALNE